MEFKTLIFTLWYYFTYFVLLELLKPFFCSLSLKIRIKKSHRRYEGPKEVEQFVQFTISSTIHRMTSIEEWSGEAESNPIITFYHIYFKYLVLYLKDFRMN